MNFKDSNARGLMNFCKNIKPLMLKLHEASKPVTLTQAEMHQISEFYLETVDVLYAQPLDGSDIIDELLSNVS